MRRALPWMVLTVSVGFNLFFVVGYYQAKRDADAALAQARLHAAEQQNRIDGLVAQLNLTQHQTRKLDEVRQRAKEPLVALMQQRLNLTRQYWNELGKANPDRKRLRSLITSMQEKQAEMKTLAAERMTEFTAMLDPQQRQRWTILLAQAADAMVP
jgi:Spy/CpxP family protein refolding chaperone